MKYLYVFTAIFLLTSCTKENIPSDSIEGKFNIINDPIKCALPTSNYVKISKYGQDLTLSFDYLNEGDITLNYVTSKQNGEETELYLDNSKIGRFLTDSYTEFTKTGIVTSKGKVLYLAFSLKGKRVEFMGRK